ncbi:MAG: DUF2249 domain-containing protein [Halolamina sp.]|uniref:DUF2249 domain-containing protein n=1 Tax=Halolamina sp. TaxID=1940283 RepID=UPI002FC3C692
MVTDQLPPLEELFVDSTVPTDCRCEYLDARELPPPEPLQNTLERLEALDGSVLVQLNDRAPQHLYPRLTDRNYQYETVNAGDVVVTAIWNE